MAVEAGGIGARLRAGREKLGLTVLQVAERIHTDPKIVEAIEAESYEALGAPVYARGHIRHYAELVGESANELIQMYSNISKVAQPDLTRIVKAPAGPGSSKLVAPALVVIVVFAVAGAIWWVSALSKKKPQMSETHVVTDETPASSAAPTPSADSTVAPEGAAADGAAGTAAPVGPSASSAQGGTSPQVTPPRTSANGSTAASSGAGRPAAAAPTHAAPSAGAPTPATRSAPSAATPTSATRTAPPAAAQSPSTRTAPPATAQPPSTRTAPPAAAQLPSARATPPAATSAASAPTRTASAAPIRPSPSAAGIAAPASTAADTAAAPRPKSQSQVTLRYSADSWTEVYDSTGARLFYDVGTANSVRTVVGTPPLRVVLGNASGVSVEYNGHSKPIAKMSRPDGSVQFSITRSGEIVRAKPVADGG